MAGGALPVTRPQRLALGASAPQPMFPSDGPRHAHLDGFDLHANVAVRGEDREGLEQLCRYLLRPAAAQDRLQLTDDGRVVLQLKTAWSDGTGHLVFEPLNFLSRLATLAPRPGINLVFCHGLLAPNARWRAAVVAYGTAPAIEPVPVAEVAAGTVLPAAGDAASRPPVRGWTWAQLMRRAFALDVLACPACGGRLRLIALIFDPHTIRAILDPPPCPPSSATAPHPSFPARPPDLPSPPAANPFRAARPRCARRRSEREVRCQLPA